MMTRVVEDLAIDPPAQKYAGADVHKTAGGTEDRGEPVFTLSNQDQSCEGSKKSQERCRSGKLLRSQEEKPTRTDQAEAIRDR